MLFTQNFSITEPSRLNEFLEFKNENLQKTDFKHEPVFIEDEGSYDISISSDAKDLASLELLFDKWDQEDKSAKSNAQKLSIFDKLFVHLRAN